MAKIFTIFNQKGGVGKTTTTINLAAGVARLEKKILLVDMDPQGNASSGLGIIDREELPNLYDIVADDTDVETCVVNVDERLDLLPSNSNLVGVEVLLAQEDNWEHMLDHALQKIEADYDYIFIDCPPSLGFLSVLALVAADRVIIPIQAEYYALEGVSQLFETIQLVIESHNPDLEIEGVILTMVDKRNNLSNQVADEVKNFFGDKLYDNVVPRNVRLAEAPSHGQSIYNYDRLSRGATAYKRISQEFLKRQGEKVQSRGFFGIFRV